MEYNVHQLEKELRDAFEDYVTQKRMFSAARFHLHEKAAELKKHSVRKGMGVESAIFSLLEDPTAETRAYYKIFNDEEYKIADKHYEMVVQIINLFKHEDKKEMELSR